MVVKMSLKTSQFQKESLRYDRKTKIPWKHARLTSFFSIVAHQKLATIQKRILSQAKNSFYTVEHLEITS